MTKPAWMKAAEAQGGVPSSTGTVPGAPTSFVGRPSAAGGAQYSDARERYGGGTATGGYPSVSSAAPHAPSVGGLHAAAVQDRSRSRSRERPAGEEPERKRKSRFGTDDRREVTQGGYAPGAAVGQYPAPGGMLYGGHVPPQLPSALPSYAFAPHRQVGHPSATGIAPPVNMLAMLTSALAASTGGASTVSVGGAGMAATRPFRRLYVGSVPMCTELELQGYINAVMSTAYMPGEHCISAHVGGSDKKFAFLEFRTVDLASAALQLDGVVFKGQPLKIRRPNDYSALGQPAPSGPPISLRLDALGIISSNVPDGPNKIFIGGLPHCLQEEQLRELLSAIGPLRGLHLVKDTGAANNKGYAFAEYVDPSISDVACTHLHGMPLGDKALTVRRAGTTGPPGSVVGMGGGGAGGGGLALTGVPGYPALPQFGMMGGVLGGMPAGPPLSASLGVASHLPTRAPTRLLRLQGMVSGADLALSPREWAELEEDIASGLSGHGAILKLHVPRGGPYAGNVYVLYGDVSASIAAAASVGSKTFDGRHVPVEYEEEARLGEIQAY